jgi:hypothetical protein
MNVCRPQGSQDGGKFFFQGRDIAADDWQDTFRTDGEVIVHHDVAEPGEFTPRNIGSVGSQIKWLFSGFPFPFLFLRLAGSNVY